MKVNRLAWLLAATAAASAGCPEDPSFDSFDFERFADGSGLSLVGSATVVDGVVRVSAAVPDGTIDPPCQP